MEIDGRYLVDISGQLVVVDISGQSVVTDISGQTIFAIISGEIQADISGDVIRITSLSGESVIPVSLSGQTVSVDISGQTVSTSISGQSVAVDISGQSVITSISGQAVDTFKRVMHTSTTTVLPANGNFSGSIVDSMNYDTIHGTVFSNRGGNLYVRQSPDGTNWDASDRITVSASAGRRWRMEVDGRYTLLTYENGGIAQSSFRLYAWLTT